MAVDVRQLRCFVAVAEELHFGRAAARLHVAQPAVSQTVKAMEAELGVVLLERTNRRVVLTDAGRVLLDHARAVVAHLDAILAAMARVRAGEEGRITLAVAVGLPPNLLPALLERFRAELPGVVVVARPMPSAASVAEALDHHGIDLAVMRGLVREPGVSSVVIDREVVGIALPARHPLAGRAAVAPRDLAGEPFATFDRTADPALHDHIFGALMASGLDGAPVLHESAAGAVDASLRLVAAGAAVSLKLASEVEAFRSADVVWRPLEGVHLEVAVAAAWRPDRCSPALARLVSLLPSIPEPAEPTLRA